MNILYLFLVIFGIVLLVIGAFASERAYVLFLIAIGLLLILFFGSEIKELEKGEPASSLNVLTKGEKYEIVGIYEKYIIVKSATDNRNNEKLRLIGPLDFGTRTLTTGRYVKTQKSLEKIE